jgi:alpha-beta hydrolase superfamily lysophospholipase
MYEDKGYTVYEKRVLSSNGTVELVGKVYRPLGEIKGYFHIVHGMTEYIGRYESFMKELVEQGYLVFGYDHLGHGKTARNDSDFGFIAERNGDDLLARDVKAFSDAIKSEYGDHPYYLMGHSMGSFIVRMATQNYLTPDKLIIMGTSGPNPIAGVGLLVCKLIKAIKGPRHISSLIDTLAFGSYNDKFKDENDSKAWLTKDVQIREKYRADKLCMFKFTVSAMHDLISLNKNCNTDAWFKAVAKKMPILLTSGEDDPVGDYGNGIRICENKLKDNGADVTLRLYPNCRHEILNDTCRDQVIKDILEFIEK